MTKLPFDIAKQCCCMQEVTDMYNLIHQAADIDNEKWEIGNITLGYWYAPHFLSVI